MNRNTQILRFWLALVAMLAIAASTPGCEVSEEDPDTQDVDNRPDLPELADIPGTGEPLMARFEPAGTDFYRMPWPSDFRVDTDGTLDMSDFPQQHQSALLREYTSTVEQVTGFSSMPVVYMPLDAPLGDMPLPEPEDTLQSTSAIQMIRLGTDCTTRIPVISRTGFYPDGYQSDTSIAVVPVPGFVLEESETYAVVITTGLTDGVDAWSAMPHPTVTGLLTSDTGTRLSDVYAPLRACLESAALDPSQILTATVFTVQDATSELRILRDVVVDPEQTAAPRITNWRRSGSLSDEGLRNTYLADYQTPIFQQGVSPYDQGGAFVFVDGKPQVQRWEVVPMVASFPDIEGLEPPYPVLIWADGTGHSRTGYLRDDVTDKALQAGFAVVSFLPQMHGSRATPGAESDIHSFNLLNGAAGRAVFRQQAIDTAYFVRVIRESLPSQDDVPALRTDKIVYGGHSQGALVGSLIAAVETEIESYMLNGLGGYLSVTMVERRDYDFASLISTLFGIAKEDITIFHPLVQLIQSGGEPVDPNNYIRKWRGTPENPDGNHVFVSNGLMDHTTFPRSMNAVCILSGATPMAPLGWDPDPYRVWDVDPAAPPIQSNMVALSGRPLTITTYLSAETGHFTLYDKDEVSTLAVQFWVTSLDGPPVANFAPLSQLP